MTNDPTFNKERFNVYIGTKDSYDFYANEFGTVAALPNERGLELGSLPCVFGNVSYVRNYLGLN